jgi:hypothetical protein
MPKVKCDWDCCEHFNFETGYCECPDDIGVELTNQEMEVEKGEGKYELEQFLVCKSYKEAGGKDALKISQELDEMLNAYKRGEVSKEQLEAKRQEMYEAIEGREKEK